MTSTKNNQERSPILFIVLGVLAVVGVIVFMISRSQKPDPAMTSAPPPSPNAQPLLPSPNRVHYIGMNGQAGGSGSGGGMPAAPTPDGSALPSGVDASSTAPSMPPAAAGSGYSGAVPYGAMPSAGGTGANVGNVKSRGHILKPSDQ